MKKLEFHNFIYDYYTVKFIQAVREEDYKSKYYFDNEILGNLIFMIIFQKMM